MGEDLEDPSCNTHSTTIKAIRVDWMLNEDEGLKFLRQTLQQKNRDIFMTIYIKVLVHFLYQKYKAKIMNFLLPPYLLHLSAVMMQIHASERYRDELVNNVYDQEDFSFIDLVEQQGSSASKSTAEVTYTNAHYWKNVWTIVCSLINFLNFMIFCKQSYYLGTNLYRRKWSMMDIMILGLNFVNTASLFISIEVFSLRIVESILCILQWFKFLYFMQLVDDIAPYVSIIFVIMKDI